jgi:hypothetical protein
MNESDEDALLNRSDTAEQVEASAESRNQETLPTGPREVTSLRETFTKGLPKSASTQWPYPTPVSFGSVPRQTSTTQELPRAWRGTNTDATALQNLRTSTGRNIRLSQRGQDAVDSSHTHATQRYTEKRARREAHALQLERARLGQQVAHAFATAQSIRTHRKDMLPPPDFWHELKRHPEGKGFRHAADAEHASLKEKKTFELVDHPDGKQVLPLKWVFTYKFDDAGYLVRHKA